MTVAPGTIHVPGPVDLAFRLRMTTRDQAERFTVNLRASAFRVKAGAGVREEGATMTPAAPATLDGPGSLTPVGEGSAIIACSGNGPAAHGYEPRFPGFLVELPANSTSTLVATYRTGEIVLWPKADIRLIADISPSTSGRGERTLERRYEASSPRVVAEGRTGSRIELITDPPSSPSPRKRVRRVRAGKRIVIRGRVDPPPKSRRITLRYRGPQARGLRTIVRARTDLRGRFRWSKWTPRRRGRYELSAVTPAGPGTYRDYACPVAFDAR